VQCAGVAGSYEAGAVGRTPVWTVQGTVNGAGWAPLLQSDGAVGGGVVLDDPLPCAAFAGLTAHGIAVDEWLSWNLSTPWSVVLRVERRPQAVPYVSEVLVSGVHGASSLHGWWVLVSSSGELTVYAHSPWGGVVFATSGRADACWERSLVESVPSSWDCLWTRVEARLW